jgi:thioredoxin 1
MKLLLALPLLAASLLAQGSLKWEHSLAAGLRRAKAENKAVFLDIWAEWCPPCQHLRQNVFPTPEAEKALARFVPVSLMLQTKDRKSIAEAVKEADPFKVEAFPTLLILDANGRERGRHLGAFPAAKEFAAWLAGQK